MNVAVVTLREILDLKRWSVAFFVASVIVCFAVSPMALGAIGVNYGSAGGAAWQKIHPATYLMALSMGFGFLGLPRRWAFLWAIPSRLPGLSFFAVMWALLTVFAAAVQHSPLTQLLDTFFIAAAALVMYDELPERVRSFVRIFLHVFLCVNAIIGAAEFFLHWRMFPLILDGEEMTDERRSTALIGHPLQNAAASGAYLLCLFFGGDAALSPMARLMLMAVQILGLACFGGRTSIAAASLIIAANLAKD
ncbi:MAG TPA: hypothetical protein VED87_08165, partial [Methylocystis sp.]|nr:hypothetical protein [Methylocystis sp.]